MTECILEVRSMYVWPVDVGKVQALLLLPVVVVVEAESASRRYVRNLSTTTRTLTLTKDKASFPTFLHQA